MSLTTPIFQRRTPTVRLPGGYQTGNPVDIARRYSPNATAFRSNLNNLSVDTLRAYYDKPSPRLSPRPAIGAAGPTGDTGSAGDMGSSASNPAPMPEVVRTDSSSADPAGTQPPQGNATQRWAETKAAWLAAGGTNRSLNKANVERGIRPAIDGRATPDPKASTTSADIRQSWGWPRHSSTDLPY